MGESDTRVDGNRLVVGGEVSREQQGLQQLWSELLQSASEEVVIDLAGITSFRSADLAVVAASCALAQKRGRKVKVRAAADVARVLRFGGVDRVARIEEIP